MNLKNLLILLLLSGLLLCESRAQESGQPNVIFILADDLGYGDIEPFGQSMIKTPNLVRMAGEGIRFTDHYAGAPVCAPSRSTLMTGMHTGNTPVRGNARDIDSGVESLPHNVQTIAEMLNEKSDYTTALYGRWHLGGIFSNSQPHQRGFDEFFGALSKYYKPLNTYYRPDLYKNGELYIIKENNNGAEGKHREDVITEQALDFITRTKDKPFFLYMAYSFVHAPIQPVPGEDMYEGRDWPQKEIDFAHNTSRLDKYVGMIMDHLQSLGISENTLIIFTSDNGPHQESGHDPEFFESNGPFKGYKRDLYEGGIRMPFIAWWPGKIRPGSVSDHPSGFWDLMPTVAEIAGIKPPAQTDGISYLPALLGREQEKHEYLYWEFRERTPRQAIRKGNWKGQYFIEYERFELYDLEADPGEEKDLASDYPDIVAELKGKMEEAHSYNSRFPITTGEKYVQVSKRNPKYMAYEDGTPFIPVGPNIPWSRTTNDPDKALEQYDRYFNLMAENGANFTRIWLGAPLWEIEHSRVYGFDMIKTDYLLDSLLSLATHYGIKIKFCIHNFRELTSKPPKFEGSVSMGRPLYHKSNGGPLDTMDEYFNTDLGKEMFLQRLYFLANQYGKHPSVFGWELWNEINAVRTSNKPEDILEWTDEMLDQSREIFPRHLVMQSMGSFDSNDKRDMYRRFVLQKNNDIAQVHRYLDPGAALDVCKGPMDILAGDAARELLSYKPGKPVIVSEVGAVEARHAGPSKLYEVDREGVLLHDLLFAPFFSGAAAPGQSWHWHHYIDKQDLWWHFGRFNEAIKGINPIKEDFSPVYRENDRVRIYTLVGKQTDLVWIRDKTSDWESELVEGTPACSVKGLKVGLETLGLTNASETVEAYLPWEDKWVALELKKGSIKLPDFKRSLVLSFSKR